MLDIEEIFHLSVCNFRHREEKNLKCVEKLEKLYKNIERMAKDPEKPRQHEHEFSTFFLSFTPSSPWPHSLLSLFFFFFGTTFFFFYRYRSYDGNEIRVEKLLHLHVFVVKRNPFLRFWLPFWISNTWMATREFPRNVHHPFRLAHVQQWRA